jgi:transcriptional regulator with XRE-family HTH domain
MIEDALFPYRKQLRDDVLAFRKANGLSPDDFAEMVGVSKTGLKSILYDKKRHVGVDFLRAWAAVSGHSIAEYLDDPGAPPPGVPQADFGQATEQQRVMTRAMGSDLAKLSPEHQRAAFEAWSSIVRGFQSTNK